MTHWCLFMPVKLGLSNSLICPNNLEKNFKHMFSIKEPGRSSVYYRITFAISIVVIMTPAGFKYECLAKDSLNYILFTFNTKEDL